VVVFLGVQLALSVFSRADYLFTQGVSNPSGVFPSDVTRMQTALFLPYWFWGLVCGAFSVLVLIYGVRTCWSR
jgi:membrane-associated phospholipid phosphatase